MSFQEKSESFDARFNKGIRTVWVSILANVLFAVVKIAAGILGSSYALIADGIESTLDVFSSAVVLGGMKIGAIPADADHPFGHGKAETLAAMTVSLVLIFVAGVIAYKSFQEIRSPHFMPAPFTLIVLSAVIVVKEVLSRFLCRVGESVNSLSLKVDAWHHRADALTSLAAFIGIAIALIGGRGFESADDWAALFASGIIALNGIRLLKESIAEIMDAAPPPETEEEIRKIASDVDGVVAIEKCRARKSGLGYFVEIHVEVRPEISVSRGHAIAHMVKNTLLKSGVGIIDVLVHIEPSSHHKGSSY